MLAIEQERKCENGKKPVDDIEISIHLEDEPTHDIDNMGNP